MKLGVSIYPEHSTLDRDREYLSLAAKYGFTKVFTCLLSVNKPVAEIKDEFRQIISHANRLGMEVFIDIAPSVFDKLGIDYDDLSFFSEIGAAGLRLDEGFDGYREAHLTYNPFGLKIEINASQGTRNIAHILSCKADRTKLTACHNFYPQRFTGLSFKHFMGCNEEIGQQGIPIAAFISSQVVDSFGPWPLNEGLCTLEMHRTLPLDVQARHLAATEMIDTAIIANAYASEQEMQSLSKIKPGRVMLGFEPEQGLTAVEHQIIFEFPHFVRGDMSEYMARSTFSRITFQDASIPPHNTADVLKPGDVVILNELYGRYKGELHVVLKEMPNDGRKNVVGRIPEDETFMLEYLTPWQKFGLVSRQRSGE